MNVTGQLVTTQAFLPMIREGKGRIVFMSSVAGRSPSIPFAGPYAASKYAIEALAESLRVELLPWDIKVSSIEPETITTPTCIGVGATADPLPRRYRCHGPHLR